MGDSRQPDGGSMITEEQALARILENVRALPAETVPLTEACGRFAASDVFARVALPRFDNSAMDGYAVVAAACGNGKSQRVIGEQPAGIDRGLRIQPGEAVRLFTGAPIPAGADAVVMQEDVRCERNDISLNVAVEKGEFIRRRGRDLAEGQKIVEAGTPIRPQTAGLLASQGLAEIEAGAVARLAIISTGDELIRPGGELAAGQIYESNSFLIRALAGKCGASVTDVAHCPDAAEAIEAAIRAGLQSDVVILLGGVSVGARDLVKPALQAAGAETELWRVAVKPGKPFLFGRAGPCAIFGLPGNPVSAFVTFLLFVRPALLRLMGARADQLSLPTVDARLATSIQNEGDRPHYVRGLLRAGRFTPIGRQESHALFGLSRANALLRIPGGKDFAEEAVVSVISLD
ncbi:MAG TPA: gephyrin-like molybdotransferase Glp [Chthoniobacterales bacterium]|nr:gephyrin-like molybdotransferase Glp [Chthoniobacterales bacterium]